MMHSGGDSPYARQRLAPGRPNTLSPEAFPPVRRRAFGFESLAPHKALLVPSNAYLEIKGWVRGFGHYARRARCVTSPRSLTARGLFRPDRPALARFESRHSRNKT